MSFKHIRTESIYEGHIFSIEYVHVSLPDEKTKIYELVRHGPAITLVPVSATGEIYFVKQYRVGAVQSLLELPAGGLEVGEDPSAGAAREIREEIGMAARKLQAIGSFFMAPGYSTEYLTIFLASDLYPAPLQPDADEYLQVIALPIDQAYQMAESGEIQDGKTLAALLLARPYLKSETEMPRNL
jgi:ADP-ribose pyrophosphatase